MSATDAVLFEIYGPDGERWCIYASGKTEGFPPGVTVVNHVLPYFYAVAEALGKLHPLFGAAP